MNQKEKSEKLFRWSIGYLLHFDRAGRELIPFGFSRVVNYSFACELLLKSHLMRENNPSSGHKLKTQLFEKLKVETQSFVKNYVSEKFPDFIDDNEPFNFDTILLEQQAVFVEWRYPFDVNFNNPLENTRGHYGFLFYLAMALIESYKMNYQGIPGYNGRIILPEEIAPNAHYILR